MTIEFKPMKTSDISLWETWIEKPHVRDIWFIEGYETADYVYQKIAGNGYDYPFIIYLNKKPVGYIQCCDLYVYRTICENPKGLFTNEKSGTYCMDLFIAKEDYLNKGYGTQIVKAFSDYIFSHFKADKIYIDPAKDNQRAIRCYEKAGFKFVREAHDGITTCHVMIMERMNR